MGLGKGGVGSRRWGLPDKAHRGAVTEGPLGDNPDLPERGGLTRGEGSQRKGLSLTDMPLTCDQEGRSGLHARAVACGPFRRRLGLWEVFLSRPCSQEWFPF